MGWQPYCNTIVTEADCWLGRQCHATKICIVTEGLGLAGFWLQYKILYCDSGLGWACWARRQELGLGRWGDRRAGASGRAEVSGPSGARRAQAGRQQRARQVQVWARGDLGAGRAAWARRARGLGVPVRAG